MVTGSSETCIWNTLTTMSQVPLCRNVVIYHVTFNVPLKCQIESTLNWYCSTLSLTMLWINLLHQPSHRRPWQVINLTSTWHTWPTHSFLPVVISSPPSCLSPPSSLIPPAPLSPLSSHTSSHSFSLPLPCTLPPFHPPSLLPTFPLEGKVDTRMEGREEWGGREGGRVGGLMLMGGGWKSGSKWGWILWTRW